MRTNENNPLDWIHSARVRLGSADRLHPLEGTSESVIELTQEATERFLKAYLIGKGWRLRKIHDLGALIAEAAAFDARFNDFLDFADELTDHFWAMHYPGGETDDNAPDYKRLRDKLDSIIQIIEGDLPLRD